VADEVICGFGRIGHWFGGAHFGMQPDLITVAKGLTSGYQPLGAVLVSTRVADVLVERGGEFSHGFTYSGHPVACAVALANIEVLEKDNLLQKVHQDVGPYLQQRWREFGDHPLVGEVRGCGLLAALELVAEKTCNQRFPAQAKVGEICRRHAYEHGLVMRAVQDTMIVAPPLITERSQVDELIGKVLMALDGTASEVAVFSC
jgi:putrescine aminotransferase